MDGIVKTATIWRGWFWSEVFDDTKQLLQWRDLGNFSFCCSK